MANLRRLQLTLSCFLAVLLAGGAVLPPPAVWRCDHAVRVVNAHFAPAVTAMPCRVGGGMPPMACCAFPRQSARRRVSGNASVSRAACRPVLTQPGALSTATAPESRLRLRQRPAAEQPALTVCAALLPAFPICTALSRRPPLPAGRSQAAPRHAPGLRAPPVA